MITMHLTLAAEFRGIAIERYISCTVPRHEIAGEVRQGAVENFRPEIYVIPNTEAPGTRCCKVAEGDWLAYDQPWRICLLSTTSRQQALNWRGPGVQKEIEF
jgi:hypothetical protein